jgi:hypothetical protein
MQGTTKAFSTALSKTNLKQTFFSDLHVMKGVT